MILCRDETHDWGMSGIIGIGGDTHGMVVLSFSTSHRLSISLPSIVRGESHQVVWPQGVPIIALPFKSAAGAFQLCLGLENIIQTGDLA